MNPVNEALFGTIRSCHFVTELDFMRSYWCIRNHKRLSNAPLFFLSSPNLEKIYPSTLAILEEYRKEKNVTAKQLKEHIIKRISSRGTCHGQCLALIEQFLRTPNQSPFKLLDTLPVDRVMYFQTLEHIRANSKNLRQTCIELFPAYHTLTNIAYRKADELKEELAKKNNTATLIRFVDSKHHISHSMLYVTNNDQFWFYDARLVGLYNYPSAAALFDGFYSHLRAFFSQSHHAETELWLETYPVHQGIGLPK